MPYYVARSFGPTIILRPLSGQFALYANGTGTASFDHFRVVQYPDPALALGQVIPRVGSTSISWTPGTQGTIGMDYSTDAINWTDVTASNNGSFPGVFSQPAPTIDVFTTNTSANYTSAFGGQLAQDTFLRANQSGWGVASDAEVWAVLAGTGASISANQGIITNATGDVHLKIGTQTTTDTESLVRTSFSATGTYALTFLRYSNDSNWYRCQITTNSLSMAKVVAGTYSDLAFSTPSLSAGVNYWLRFRIQGTTLSGKVWPDGTTEPSTWTLTTTDSSIASGGFGLGAFLGATSATTTFDHYAVGVPTSGVPAWVYDTANSRILATSGTNGVYIYPTISRADIDMFVDMDRSDAGGMVWRYSDQSDFYYLLIADASASVGTPNQLTLFRVVANVQTQLATASISFARGTYHRFRTKMLGNVITVTMDGVNQITYTDTSPLSTAGSMGLFNNGGATGSRYYQLWQQPQGDYVSGTPIGDIVTGGFVYTRARLSTTDPAQMPTLLDLTVSARNALIADGALIPQLHDPSKPFAEFYSKEMDNLVASSGDYYWLIDQNKNLTFAPRNATPAPWILTSADLLFAPAVQPTVTADLYRNRQTITNCTGVTATLTEQKIADGTATSWNMAYPLYSAPTITVQGVAQTIGVKGVDTGKQLYWQANNNSITQDSGAAKIPSGYVISVTYVGQFVTIVTVNNTVAQTVQAAIEGNSGIVEAVEDGKGMLASAATTYANGLLARYGNNNAVQLTATTQRSGLVPGMVIAAFIPEHQLNNRQLLITKVTTSGFQKTDGTVQYQYTIIATDGVNLSTWWNAL